MKYLAIILALALSGCATQQERPVITIKQCPKPTIPVEPSYPASAISVGASPDVKAKALVQSYATCMGYKDELKTILQGYEKLE